MRQIVLTGLSHQPFEPTKVTKKCSRIMRRKLCLDQISQVRIDLNGHRLNSQELASQSSGARSSERINASSHPSTTLSHRTCDQLRSKCFLEIAPLLKRQRLRARICTQGRNRSALSPTLEGKLHPCAPLLATCAIRIAMIVRSGHLSSIWYPARDSTGDSDTGKPARRVSQPRTNLGAITSTLGVLARAARCATVSDFCAQTGHLEEPCAWPERKASSNNCRYVSMSIRPQPSGPIDHGRKHSRRHRSSEQYRQRCHLTEVHRRQN